MIGSECGLTAELEAMWALSWSLVLVLDWKLN